MMREIFIARPGFNPDSGKYASYTYLASKDVFSQIIRDWGFSPQTHPKAIDLCAGDGSMARILYNLGWSLSNLVCVDWYRPQKPLVPLNRFLFWDLEALGRAIKTGKPIPNEVLAHKQKYHLVFALQSTLPLDIKDIQRLGEFFVLPGQDNFVWVQP